MLRMFTLAAMVSVPSVASADLLTVWAAGKADYVRGTGDVYTRFDESFGFGVEGGIEVIGLDLWGEALAMGSDQFLFTVNLGFDLDFGDDVRLVLGLFTGPMFFVFPEQEPQTLQIDGAVRTALEDAGVDVAEIEMAYNENAAQQEELSRLAVGWNLGRLQLNLEVSLASVLYLGLGGEVGYHFLLSGEEAAAGAKNQVVDDVASEHDLEPAPTEELREAVGAKDVDPDSLNGLNYQIGAYLKLEL